MDIRNKTVYFLGDSITEGAGASSPASCFVSLFQKAYPEAKIINDGIGGTRISRQKGYDLENRYDLDFMYRAEKMPENFADLIVVFGGTNDFGHGNATLGSYGDSDPYTFYGALEILYTTLLKKCPRAKFLVLTPMHRLTENERNAASGRMLCDYVAAVKEMARDFSFAVLDLFAESGINPKKGNMQVEFMPDGLHPNDRGHGRLFELIDNTIRYKL